MAVPFWRDASQYPRATAERDATLLRSRWLVWAILASLVLAAAVGPWLASAEEKKKEPNAYITGFDVLALPGKKVPLRAKLERHGLLGLQPDVHGDTLHFFLGDRLLGSEKTKGDGIAEVSFEPPGPGQHQITVRLDGKSKYRADDAPLIVAVYPPETRFFVTDIDHTVADISAVEFLLKPNEKVPVVKDSVEVLGRLSSRYVILYVTARDEAFTRKTREWLVMKQFPRGPVFFWDFLGADLSHRRYKTALIANLKKSFPNIAAGAGDLPEDGQAYLDNKMRAFVITSEPKNDDIPKGAEPVAGWKEIEAALEKK